MRESQKKVPADLHTSCHKRGVPSTDGLKNTPQLLTVPLHELLHPQL
jgi:hypothetical protein